MTATSNIRARTKLRKRYTYLFFLLAIPVLSIGQELRFHQYTMGDGLSNAGTYWLESIIQDREGFMWFTTFNGLNRFDGKNFKKFQYSQNNPNGLGNNLTTAICEAEDGRIWVGSSSGIYIFDPKTETFEQLQHDPADPQSLSGNDINFINKDPDGDMWVGTAVDGVCRWSKETGEFTDFGGYFRDGLAFFQQKNGTIWIGTMKGLFKKTPGEDAFLPIGNFAADRAGNKRYASDITELPDGNLMVTSNDNGLWIYNPNTQVFNDLTPEFHSKFKKAPICLLADKSGKIWMGADDEVQSYDPVTGRFEVFGNEDDDPASVPKHGVVYGYQDAAGSLWFVTSGGGVIVAHSPQHPFEKMGGIYPGEVVRLDGNRLLINGFDQLGILDEQQGKLTATGFPASLLDSWTESLALSGKNELWVQQKGADHVKVLNLETGKIRRVPGRTPWLKTGPGGRIWSGFKYFDEAQNQWVDLYPKIQGLPDSSKIGRAVVDIHFGEHGVVWLATNAGIFKYNLGTQQGKKYELYPGNGQAANVVHRIYPGEGGRFYLITSNGLSMFDPTTDRFLSFNESNGLLHNQVTTVVEDAHGHAWISTPKGLHRLDLATRTFTNFDINDGLPGIHFNFQRAFRDSGGYLYFSVDNEFFRFHPDSLKPKTYVAPVHLLDFYLNHKKVRPQGEDSLLEKQLRFDKKIGLRYDQANFGFSFVMPVFYKSADVEYFYQLAPYEKDWQSAGSDNNAHYTNIDPGEYTFQVKAKTADGNWSPNVANIQIGISPPFYRTMWAYFIYFIATGGLLLFIRHFEMRRQGVKAETLRLQELDSLKSRLYTNITHEFRTPLTVIMGMTDNIRGHLQERRLIRRNSKNLLRLINQLLDLSKLDSGSLKMDLVQGDIINYLQYLTESFYSMAHEKKVRLTFYSEIPELEMDFDEVKIQHIVYNLLSNAIKFTNEQGKVVLHANRTQRNGLNYLRLKIQDTGIGIAEAQLKHIFNRFFQANNSSTRGGEGTGIGLALTKELVELMGGSISVKSEVEKGTTFTLLLPIRLLANTPKPQTGFQSSRTLASELVPDQPTAPSPVILHGETAGKVGEKPILLVIEDNADVTTYIIGLLEKEYGVHTAVNGRTGIEKAINLVPDIIISDVMMPEKDGYEVCETLKNDERTSHIPIILLTAKAAEADRIAGLRKGADAYLMKPFNKEELYIRLEKLLELRRKLQERFSKISKFGSSEKTKPTLEDVFLQKLFKVVEDRLGDTDLSVADLCRSVHLSNMQVNRKLKALTGKTPSLFIRSIRLQKGMELLQSTQLTISEIAYEAGFSDPNYFSRAFSEEFGLSPSGVRGKN